MFKKSFTLIETLVVISVFSLLIGASAGAVVHLYRTHSYTENQAVAVREARRGIFNMVKEIREARTGEDGSYPIEKAAEKEFIFYSDIDKDEAVERVRYFLGSVASGSQSKDCVSFSGGGSCNVVFSDFLQGDLTSAEVTVSVEGDFGWWVEYAEVYADGQHLGNLCEDGCSDCAGSWEGNKTFDVTGLAEDGTVDLSVDSTSWVDPICNWQDWNHSLKAKFDFSWTEEITGQDHEFKKGITDPTGSPPGYPLDQEKIQIISSYVRNAPPIFEYYDSNGEKITEYPARLLDTKLMNVFLIINVDPNRPPQDFELESSVKLSNLRNE